MELSYVVAPNQGFVFFLQLQLLVRNEMTVTSNKIKIKKLHEKTIDDKLFNRGHY